MATQSCENGASYECRWICRTHVWLYLVACLILPTV